MSTRAELNGLNIMHKKIKNLTNNDKRLRWSRSVLNCDEYVVQPYGNIIRVEHSSYRNEKIPVIESPFDAGEILQLYCYFTVCLNEEKILTKKQPARSHSWNDPRYLIGMIYYLFYGIVWKNNLELIIDDVVTIENDEYYYANYDPSIAKNLCSYYRVSQQNVIECYRLLEQQITYKTLFVSTKGCELVNPKSKSIISS